MVEGRCYAISKIVASLLHGRVVVGEYWIDDKEYGSQPYGHCWTEVGDVVIDLTLSQFNKFSTTRLPLIYIGNRRHYDQRRTGEAHHRQP